MAAKHDLAALVAAVQEGAKYRRLDPTLIEAVAAAELSKGRSFKETVKATRNKLHQVAGAYLPDRPDYNAWLRQIEQASGSDELAAALRQVMAHHASTRERLPFLDSIYATLLGDLPPIHTLLDLACGLNPLAAKWMPLAADATYYACDIYQDQIEFLNRAFPLLGKDGQAGQAFVANLAQATPTQQADVALLLKTIPCLEQLDKQIGPRLLAEINAPVIIVSFPARSLGGQGKGMVENYAAHFDQLAAGQPWQIKRYEFPSELVFRIVREPL